MNENEIARIVVDACVRVHRDLGPGLLESVYEAVLAHELSLLGLRVQRQVAIPIVWNGMVFEEAFRADLLIEDTVIVELKAVPRLAPVDHKKLLTYLRLSNRRLGLLVNFSEGLIKDGITRLVNGLDEAPDRGIGAADGSG